MPNIDITVTSVAGGAPWSEQNSTTCTDLFAGVGGIYNTLLRVIFFFNLALGVPGNLLSAIVWLRRHIISKNTSAIYLAALAVNDIVFLLVKCSVHVDSGWMAATFIVGCTMLLESLFVVAFSVERLIAILWPLQVSGW